MVRVSEVLVATAVSLVLAVTVAAQQVPAPQPFPRSSGGPPVAAPAPPPSRTPTPPPSQVSAPPVVAAAAPASGAPTDAMLGVPGVIYPTSEFLKSFEVGRGQRCYLFGTNASFAEMIAYYRQVLKDGGRELFKAPAMQQFDLGRFQDQTMVYPPSVVVKDYASASSGTTEGYLQVDGTRQRRFKTVIQVVPMPGR